jgi:hypothetical protein
MAVVSVAGKLAIWIRRYGPSELLSLAATLSCSWLVLRVSDNIMLAAIAGTWAENLAYYGLMVWRELWADGRPSRTAALRSLRDLLLEFGPTELLDSLLVRPAVLAAGLAFASSPLLGALAAKLAADLVFYVPTIISYELIRRRRADSRETTLC